MLPYIRYKSNKKILNILMFIPNIIMIFIIALFNLFISIAYKTYDILTKKYKNELAYISFISLVIAALFYITIGITDYKYMLLDNFPLGLKITFGVLFSISFIAFLVLSIKYKKKHINRFWLVRTISYIVTFILFLVCLDFAIHYLRTDGKVFKALCEGSLYTIILFIVTLVFGLPLGLLLAFGSMSKHELIKKPVKTLIWIIRGTPLMLQILVVSSIPLVFSITNKDIYSSIGISLTILLFIYVCIAFIINYACYFSEIYRSGIESTPKGQYEASKVLGMTKRETFFKVVLMQVVKKIIPPMSNEIITLVKDTALASVLVAIDLFSMAKHEVNNSALLTPFVYAAIFYLIFNGILTICFSNVEKKLAYYEV